MQEQATQNVNQNSGRELSVLVINLLKSVLYQEQDAGLWNQLLNLQARVRDHVAVLALELVLDAQGSRQT